MRYNKSHQTKVAGSNPQFASSAGNALTHQLTLSENQIETIKDFYGLLDADNCKDQLTELLSIYVASSCPEFGELSQEDIEQKSLIVSRTIKLLKAMEPLGLKN